MQIAVMFKNGDRIEDSARMIRQTFFTDKIFPNKDLAWRVLHQYGILRTVLCTFIVRDHRFYSNLKKEIQAMGDDTKQNWDQRYKTWMKGKIATACLLFFLLTSCKSLREMPDHDRRVYGIGFAVGIGLENNYHFYMKKP